MTPHTYKLIFPNLLIYNNTHTTKSLVSTILSKWVQVWWKKQKTADKADTLSTAFKSNKTTVLAALLPLRLSRNRVLVRPPLL